MLVGTWVHGAVRLRPGAVGRFEHRQPAGDAGQAAAVFCTFASIPARASTSSIGALGDTGADVIGGLAMSRSKLDAHTEVFAERLVAAMATQPATPA